MSENQSMESCDAVLKEIDSLLSKLDNFNERCNGILATLITNFENLNREMQLAPADADVTASQMDKAKQSIKDMMQILPVLSQEHKDLHGNVSRIGKCIDRNFTSDYSTIERENLFNDIEIKTALNRMIVQHLYREGFDDIAEIFKKESGLEEGPEMATDESYKEIRQIVHSILDHDVEPALTWVANHIELLEPLNSMLEYKLHRLAFLQILEHGVEYQLEAVTYSKMYLQKFFPRFESDVLTLMGALMYAPRGLKRSPYDHLLSEGVWVEAADDFLMESCKVLNLTTESPLAISINAGCRAIPALQNMKQVIQSQQIFGIWHDLEELPLEIEVGMDYRYHSVFACPILRQRSSEENPPMRLVCGHVITKEALNELSIDGRLKCPYCPLVQEASDAKIVYF